MDELQSIATPTPEAILAMLRAEPAPDADREEVYLNHLVERFPADRLGAALRARLDHLAEADGAVVLRLLEGYLTPELAAALAQALARQPDLRPDRAWEALAVLDGAGLLDSHPELAERWDELNDAIDPELATEGLADQLDEEPEGSWVALEGLGAIEPETRHQIIASLADAPTGPGLVAFLRLLTFAHDDATRAAAVEALFDPRRDDPEHRQAWAEVAHDHFDPRVVGRARRRLGVGGRTDVEVDGFLAAALAAPTRPRPELVGSLVTPVDGSGRGGVVLAARDRDRWVVVATTCDVFAGVVAVEGQVDADPASVARFFEAFAAIHPGPLVEDDLDLAPAILSGAWLLSGPGTNPALRFWIERTIGPDFWPRPPVGAFDAEDVAAESLALLAEPIWAILEACPTWVDRSTQTFNLAEAILLRGADATPDPRRDAGSYRFLFEHHLAGRMEHYRRLLLWMGSFWHAAGDPRPRPERRGAGLPARRPAARRPRPPVRRRPHLQEPRRGDGRNPPRPRSASRPPAMTLRGPA